MKDESVYDWTFKEWETYCKENITAGPAGDRDNDSFAFQSLRKYIYMKKQLDIRNNMFIVDIGCGNGRFPIGLTMNNIKVTYVGIEIIKGCVDFLKATFSNESNFTFYHENLYNSRYNPKGKRIPGRVIYPIKDNQADLVLFSSIFTHIASMNVIKHMLDEARRILCKGGICYCIWFLSPPNHLSRKALRVVHSETLFREAISDWTLLDEKKGKTKTLHDQHLVQLLKE
ncbi:MAG: class I SAM-dependent methyltransferase [Chloroflexi bacterium]|nr:class I SAM-dependent methyltransferase [Chloroflexota bacterium]